MALPRSIRPPLPDLRPILEHYGYSAPLSESWVKGLCPVHHETHPSCSFNMGSGYLECHACGFKGGAVKLIMEKEGLDREAATARCQEITGSGDGLIRGGDAGKSGSGIRGSGTRYRPSYRSKV